MTALQAPGTRSSTVDYASCREALEHAEADVSVAEFHGTLCAFICTRSPPRIRDWLPEIVVTDGGVDVASGSLEQVGEQTLRAFERGEYELKLLLPEDDVGLDERGRALADWCTGFLFGLGLSGEALRQRLSDDGREVVADLIELSRLDGEDDDGEGAERDYAELVEYVRVGALLIYEELCRNPAPGALH